MTMQIAQKPLVTPQGKPGRSMSYDEFLHADFDHNHYEWVDGEAVEMAAVDLEHAKLTSFLITVLNMAVTVWNLGRILGEPFQTQSSAGGNGRAPDLMFLSTSIEDYLEQLVLRGPADLIIEVASDGTRRIDRGAKFREYEAGGVPEYWMPDPKRKKAEFYQLGPDGKYRQVPPGPDGIYHCRAIPGVWVRPEWFWNRPAPLEVLKAWGVL